MKNIVLILFGLSILLMISCEKQLDTEADTEKIKNMIKKYDEAYTSGDVDECLTQFTEDAIRMPPNSSVMIGKNAIREYFESRFNLMDTELKSQVDEIIICIDWAIARGSFKGTSAPKSGEDASQDVGKWINIYKRQADGSWKSHHNIWNSDLQVKK